MPDLRGEHEQGAGDDQHPRPEDDGRARQVDDHRCRHPFEGRSGLRFGGRAGGRRLDRARPGGRWVVGRGREPETSVLNEGRADQFLSQRVDRTDRRPGGSRSSQSALNLNNVARRRNSLWPSQPLGGQGSGGRASFPHPPCRPSSWVAAGSATASPHRGETVLRLKVVLFRAKSLCRGPVSRRLIASGFAGARRHRREAAGRGSCSGNRGANRPIPAASASRMPTVLKGQR